MGRSEGQTVNRRGSGQGSEVVGAATMRGMYVVSAGECNRVALGYGAVP